MTGAWSVLTLAPPSAEWPGRLVRWSMDGTLPVSVTKCASVAEVETRLATGRPWSALLLRPSALEPGVELAGALADAGVALIELGADEVDPAALVERLEAVAAPVRASRSGILAAPEAPPRRGRLVAVTGPGGTGASVAAMAIAQGLVADGSTLLVDGCRHADLGMFHDVTDPGPGLLELVESHRRGPVGVDATRALTWSSPSRGYRLLLGLRRPTDWTALRRRALTAAVDSLVAGWDRIVVDVDPDLDGEARTGSIDVEERHQLARTLAGRADLVVVVATPDLRGVHRLGRLVPELCELVPPERVHVVLSAAPRSPRRRSELTRAVATVLEGSGVADALPSPVFSRSRSSVEAALVEGTALPASAVGELANPVRAHLGRLTPRAADEHPEVIVPGSLGSAG